MHFDDAERWDASYDLQTVALHEIGHSLGLAHSSDPSSVMYPSYQGRRVNLGSDDIDGITTIYGDSSGRIPLFRYWSDLASDHFYTTSWAELGNGGGKAGWSFEGVQCFVWSGQENGEPLFRYNNPYNEDHLYTTNWNEVKNGGNGYHYEGIQCYVKTSQEANLIPLHRYWSSERGDHFYTTNKNEIGDGGNGWIYEGIACFVMQPPNSSLYTPSDFSMKTTVMRRRRVADKGADD